MPRLYLIRHGRPAAAWGGPEDDPGLDLEGRAQAQAACDQLMVLPQDLRPVRVISSPLRRCLETAGPTAEALGASIEVEPRVGEIPMPAGLSQDERPGWLRQAFRGAWRDIPGDLDYERWRGGVADALVGLGGAAVFTHFVAINAVVSLLEVDARVLSFRPDHASVTVLETDGVRLTLVAKGAEAQTQVL